MENLKLYYTDFFKKSINWKLKSLSSLVASMVYNSENINLIERSHLYFIDETGKERIFRLIFRGYDALSDFKEPSHGIIVSEVFRKDINHDKFYEGFYLSFEDGFILKKVTIWSDSYLGLKFGKISDILALHFSNGKSIYFRLTDRQEVDLFINYITPQVFFTQYPDKNERQLVLLANIE